MAFRLAWLLLLSAVVAASVWIFVELRVSASGSCLEERLVCDESKIFSTEQSDTLKAYHGALLQRYDIDYRVTVREHPGEDIALATAAAFRDGAVGSRSSTRKGFLLVIDPAAQMVRLEVSAGLDAVYTDAFVAYLQHRQMAPFFQENRVADGILATTEMIVTRAQDARKGQAFVPPEQLPENLAIGAGAQSAIRIGGGYERPQNGSDMPGPSAAASPLETVARYHEALREGNAAPDLPIYSRASRELRGSWTVTPAQMKNELRAYSTCTLDRVVELEEDQPLAVVRYGVTQRQCAPYFLVYEDDAWRLDFVTMMQSLRFNIDNFWRMEPGAPSPYAKAFSDWRFDDKGFPHPPAE
ncbi:MAG: TPM domain-containing protein [Azoarcus sp.]|nr:TPM domain-containing protein [Azoarcus sp.]